MPDKTKTIVVIERHEQTIIRRSRRTVNGQVLREPEVIGEVGFPFLPRPVSARPGNPPVRRWLTAATSALCQRLRGRLKPVPEPNSGKEKQNDY